MKKLVRIILVLMIIMLPSRSLAATFIDMPEDWSKLSLKKAVQNGLLLGSNGKIMPNKKLTRAEMATILNRSFGSYEEGSLLEFRDVQKSDWYYSEMAKAVQMKLFEGSNKFLSPDDSITREQAFVVIARALNIKPIMEQQNEFKDVDKISDWAKGEIFALIQAGYIQGSNNMINPKGYVTRAEFAKLMDNIIQEYITSPGVYKAIEKGNVMINSKDVKLKDLKIDGDIIIGEGVADGNVTLENVLVKGRIVVRSTNKDAIKIIKQKVTNDANRLEIPNKVEEKIDNKPTIDKPVISKPDVSKPILTKPIESRPIESKPIEKEPIDNGPKIVTAYNHAYQENYNVDSLSKIESNAKNAYILLDPDNNQAIDMIPKFKENNNVVSAYISIGTGETWRDDFNELKPFLVGKSWDQWSDEYFINEVKTGVIEVMKKRLDKLKGSGFQWVEFDNMDWAFDNQMRKEYGFKVTAEDAKAYYGELAKYANSIGLKVMAKNTTIGAELFHGVTYESYSNDQNWWPESELKNFLNLGKIGLIIHYNESNPLAIYEKYQNIYGTNLLFMAESKSTKEYINYVLTKN